MNSKLLQLLKEESINPKSVIKYNWLDQGNGYMLWATGMGFNIPIYTSRFLWDILEICPSARKGNHLREVYDR